MGAEPGSWGGLGVERRVPEIRLPSLLGQQRGWIQSVEDKGEGNLRGEWGLKGQRGRVRGSVEECGCACGTWTGTEIGAWGSSPSQEGRRRLWRAVEGL